MWRRANSGRRGTHKKHTRQHRRGITYPRLCFFSFPFLSPPLTHTHIHARARMHAQCRRPPPLSIPVLPLSLSVLFLLSTDCGRVPGSSVPLFPLDVSYRSAPARTHTVTPSPVKHGTTRGQPSRERTESNAPSYIPQGDGFSAPLSASLAFIWGRREVGFCALPL